MSTVIKVPRTGWLKNREETLPGEEYGVQLDTYPEPGHRFGPCSVSCDHRQCARQRALAARTCKRCGSPIGFQTPHLRDPEPSYGHDENRIHLDCFLQRV